MDDGEVESPSPGGADFLDYSQFLDDSSVSQNDWGMPIGTQICSHKHICNPTTGPDNTHTHTCEHTHTHTIGSGDDEKLLTKKRRPSGNKEAVRKYREKQKAVKVNLEVRNAELEKENRRIPELVKENLSLRRKLQEQSPRQDAVKHLLAENKRLKSLLSQFRRTIDMELDGLEGASYQDLLFVPYKKDRAVGGHGHGHLPSVGAATQCAAPVPCFPTRPVAHHRSGELTDHDVEHMDGSLGWHAECELGDKAVTACFLPQEKVMDVDVGIDDVMTPSSNAHRSSSCPKRPSPTCGCLSKSAAVAESIDCELSNLENQCGQQQQPVSTSGGGIASEEHREGVPCPVTSLPLPCFNTNGPPTVSSLSLQPTSLKKARQARNQPEECDIVCEGAEVTTDDSCPILSTSEREGASSKASNTRPGSNAPAIKVTEPARSSTFLFPACFYTDDLMTGGGQSAAIWNQHLSPGAADGWLEECDIIDGVCQAHLANAIQTSRFDYAEVEGPPDGVSTPTAPMPTQ